MNGLSSYAYSPITAGSWAKQPLVGRVQNIRMVNLNRRPRRPPVRRPVRAGTELIQDDFHAPAHTAANPRHPPVRQPETPQ